VSLPRSARLCFSVVIAAASLLGADEIRWGEAERGLQVGIVTRSTPQLEVHVLVKNVGPEERTVAIGYESPGGPIYDVNFTLEIPEGPERHVFDSDALKNLPTGLPMSRVVRLEPGAIHDLSFPLQRLICVIDGQDVGLSTLLQRGYSVRASLDLEGATVRSSDLSLEH
jgi:hypothetical protein